jgi:uncharacterized protein
MSSTTSTTDEKFPFNTNDKQDSLRSPVGRRFYHSGMRQLQDHFDGRRLADVIAYHHVRTSLSEKDCELISEAQFFFIASAYGGCVDCSIKSGASGFVRIKNSTTIEYPEYDGNSMYRTLGNMSANPNCGLLFVRFDRDKTRLRINGHAQVSIDPADLVQHRGAKAVVKISCQLYPNCSRYLPDINLVGLSRDTLFTDPPSTPPPSWKQLKHLCEFLPKDDPHKVQIDRTRNQFSQCPR